MSKLLMIALSLFCTNAMAVTQNLECKYNGSSAMNLFTLSLTTNEQDNTLSMDLNFTSYGSLVTNTNLKGTTALDSATNGQYLFVADKDPFNGAVGTYVWTFSIPSSFLDAGTLSNSFQSGNSSTFMGWQWEGTPSGIGNNTGLGMLFDWYCRTL